MRAWLFEPPAARRAAERRLRVRGVHAELASAYKPLVHAFLEAPALADAGRAAAVEIAYPVLAGAPPERFLVECHPIDAMLGGLVPTFRARAPIPDLDPGTPDAEGAPPLAWEVRIEPVDAEPRTVRVPVPVRRALRAHGPPVLAACGWHEGPLETDLELALAAALQASVRLAADGAARRAPPGTSGTSPERLAMRLRGPFEDVPLGVDEEHASLAEAMHEELLFGAMERLREGVGASPALQIAPLVSASREPGWTLEVRREPVPSDGEDDDVEGGVASGEREDAAAGGAPCATQDLDVARSWLSPRTIAAHLEAIGGERTVERTRCGRTVEARRVRARAGAVAPGVGVVLTAGRHANETTGMVGALRAARELAAAGATDLVVAPLLNPDGYALFRECTDAFARHMHHAGRYSAAGRDPGDDPDDAARRTLDAAFARVGVALHVDCHGYPAHEWARPFSGHLPPGFERWALPRGFFLICRHAPGLRAAADRVVDAAVAALGTLPALVALNAEQLARHARYLPRETLEVRSGVAVSVAEASGAACPIQLVTEAPDETVEGDRFALLHEAHRRAALAAVAAVTGLATDAGARGPCARVSASSRRRGS